MPRTTRPMTIARFARILSQNADMVKLDAERAGRRVVGLQTLHTPEAKAALSGAVVAFNEAQDALFAAERRAERAAASAERAAFTL